MYLLGVDGGGTKTTAVLCNENHEIICSAVSGPLNHLSSGLETARENLRSAVRSISEKSGVKRFDSVFIGSSALSGRASQKELDELTRGIADAGFTGMNSDVYIALRAASVKNALAVISGTGSMAAAFMPDGSVVTAGGYGYILGDEGSAFDIGLRAMKSAVRFFDGDKKAAALAGELCSYLGADSPGGIIEKAYSPALDRESVAGFARTVDALAVKGDNASAGIMKDAASALALTVGLLAQRLPYEPSVFLTGGVFENSSLYRSLFENALGFSVKMLPYPPVMGAVFAAEEQMK